MPFNTFGVATAVTPSVIETYFSHFLYRRPLRQKPTAHISYHEGLKLIRQFLDYSSKHAVEELQAFTAQWVPAPTWVRIQDVEVPPQFLKRSANVLRQQLGPDGIERVGGAQWWQWRRPESPMHAEWIEMKKDFNERKRTGKKCDRVILYIHGGAYYFGSVDEHRYQMQRHARKLKARVLAPRYRLAPQFPFPCGLQDCIATYFYLLEHFEPSQVILAGDSAGGGMVLSMLTTLRDQGCPLPAGTILLSPWVDLTHSFPSVAGDGSGDYIPPHGFHHRPSMAWPPPPQTEEKAKEVERKFTQPVEQAFEVVELPATIESGSVSVKPSRDNLREAALEDAQRVPSAVLNQMPGLGQQLQLTIDDKIVQIREQFQMYAPNELLTHPLVSPVQSPSLGGLPPMLIQVGGAELLRDEQIYLAHKAANPRAYPPSNAVLNQYDPERIILNQYPPTDVQLQVWEDLCHVAHTLSFTRPAKYMFRSVAQFGAWALARAQNKGIEILDDDAISIISNEEDDGTDLDDDTVQALERTSTFGSIGIEGVTSTQFKLKSIGAVGKAGDQLPRFKNHMVRQRVNRHGVIFPLPHTSEIASLHLNPDTIGALKPGPVGKWLSKRQENEQKYASDYKKVMKKRAKELQEGLDPIENGERPPASAIVNRRRKGTAPEEKKRGKGWGLAMWSGWGSSHDESTILREEKMLEEMAEAEDQSPSVQRGPSVAAPAAANSAANLEVPGSTSHETETEAKSRRRTSGASAWSRNAKDRPRSPYTKVRDSGQTSNSSNRDTPISPVAGAGVDDGPRQVSTGSGWDLLNRRASGASGKSTLRDRPISVAGVPPTPNPVPPSPTLSGAAPVTGSLVGAKEAVKVPGTDYTFLNPDSSRPHSGIVAFPFKLRKGSGAEGKPSHNPSTVTLDSVEQSDRGSAASAKGTSAAASPSSGYSAGAAVPRSGSDFQGFTRPETSESAIASTATAPQTGTSRRESAPSATSGRPFSAFADYTTVAYQPLDPSEEEPVSPVEHSPQNSSEDLATRPRQRAFESRDSRLGFLGADGMPLSAWPERSQSTASEQSDDAPRHPFKIRNPVYDARAQAVSTAPQQQPDGSVDASKPAPFKMRHTIYDPKVAPIGSKPPGEQVPATASGAAPTSFANDAATTAAVTATLASTKISRESNSQSDSLRQTSSPNRTPATQTAGILERAGGVPTTSSLAASAAVTRPSSGVVAPPVPPKNDSPPRITTRGPGGANVRTESAKREAQLPMSRVITKTPLQTNLQRLQPPAATSEPKDKRNDSASRTVTASDTPAIGTLTFEQSNPSSPISPVSPISQSDGLGAERRERSGLETFSSAHK